MNANHLVYDSLKTIHTQNKDVYTSIFQDTRPVGYISSSRRHSNNQSFDDFLNDQVIPDIEMSYECSIPLPNISNQRNNT